MEELREGQRREYGEIGLVQRGVAVKLSAAGAERLASKFVL